MSGLFSTFGREMGGSWGLWGRSGSEASEEMRKTQEMRAHADEELRQQYEYYVRSTGQVRADDSREAVLREAVFAHPSHPPSADIYSVLFSGIIGPSTLHTPGLANHHVSSIIQMVAFGSSLVKDYSWPVGPAAMILLKSCQRWALSWCKAGHSSYSSVRIRPDTVTDGRAG